jgi:pimeloyl-ACP methyl ester carboxylesterase
MLLTAVLGFVLVSSACTAPASPSAPSSPSAGPTGPAASGDFAGLVEVGGHQVYLECHGSGSPTVILQSGYPNAGDIWNVAESHPPPVAEGLAVSTRVCLYDRPGSLLQTDDSGQPVSELVPGRSQMVPVPRTGAQVVGELHDLLASAGVSGPYVLVGHSLGGLFNLLYARTHPDQVVGMVMVDATLPALPELMTAEEWDTVLGNPILEPQSPIEGYAMESYDVRAMIEEINAAPVLPRIPTVLLVADKTQPGVPKELTEIFDRVTDEARARFAASIPGSRLTRVPNTTHYIQLQRPDVVIETTASVIAQVR